MPVANRYGCQWRIGTGASGGYVRVPLTDRDVVPGPAQNSDDIISYLKELNKKN